MAMAMTLYSFLLTLALGVSAPWWLWRMARSGRYREGLGERLGRVPAAVRGAVAGKNVVWVHAVSVGEVLAAERLIAELKATLGEGWVVAVSTTTATGQKIARDRLAGCPVFYFPLDFAFTMRAWLRVLRPRLMVLVESEFWPRHLAECECAGVPVAVVNARVSDRSFPRYMRLRRLWKPLLEKVSLFMTQGEESAERLRAIGVAAERVRVSGNLKYDLPAVEPRPISKKLGELRGASRVIVAGSTHEGEEKLLLQAWPRVLRGAPDAILVIAPRHPQRFCSVAELIAASGFRLIPATALMAADAELAGGTIVMLDTIGDLASLYAVAKAAFIGGSLVPKGGHNPLEAARFGVPTVMGPSYENFREIVDGMMDAGVGPAFVRQIHPGTDVVPTADLLSSWIIETLRNGRDRGRRSKVYFDSQTGSTATTIDALLLLIIGDAP